MEVGKTAEIKQEEDEMSAMKEVPIIDALLLNRLVVYEKDEKNVMQLIYGVEIA